MSALPNCKFCNFYRIPGHADAYITDIETYKRKIEETFRWGVISCSCREDTIRSWTGLLYFAIQPVKIVIPHAEAAYARTTGNSAYQQAGKNEPPRCPGGIKKSGNGLPARRRGRDPGRSVRRLISKGKCGSQEWLDIMHEAHKLHVTSSATMMFGHVETLQERMDHLVKIREVQSRKPAEAKGFLAFIPWTFQDVDTLLTRIRGVHNLTTPKSIFV